MKQDVRRFLQGCDCKAKIHKPQMIVLTGGPGAGKTAVLESAKRILCKHVAILPEAAGILFTGGFWRRKTLVGQRSAQKAIFHVQTELENVAMSEKNWGVILCDRGTLDGLAYWRGQSSTYWKSMGSTQKHEFMKYKTVIHLRVPYDRNGYNHENPMRIESHEEAQAIDRKIGEAWSGHPNYLTVDARDNFLEKTVSALELVMREVPKCCAKQS